MDVAELSGPRHTTISLDDLGPLTILPRSDRFPEWYNRLYAVAFKRPSRKIEEQQAALKKAENERLARDQSLLQGSQAMMLGRTV